MTLDVVADTGRRSRAREATGAWARRTRGPAGQSETYVLAGPLHTLCSPCKEPTALLGEGAPKAVKEERGAEHGMKLEGNWFRGSCCPRHSQPKARHRSWAE